MRVTGREAQPVSSVINANTKYPSQNQAVAISAERLRWYQRAMIPGDHGTRLGQELTDKRLAGFAQGGGAWTYRIAPLCAAVAAAQLPKLDTFNAARQANFDRLRKRLAGEVSFIRFPSIHRGSVRGWYNTPAFYQADQGRVSRDLFCEACVAEGARVGGAGYANFYEIPLFQDPKLYGQLWPVQHTSGVAFEPLAPGSLKNHEDVRRRNLLLPIPAEACPDVMDQVGDAIIKVAGNMDALAKEQRRRTAL